MKKTILKSLLFLLFIPCLSLQAQAPEKISYQAVIRNASGNLIENSSVGMRISILEGSSTGASQYVETQMPTSNINGLVSFEIGGGSSVSGDFATIDWSNGIYYIKTEIDPAGGTNYSIAGTTQLLSVPYALHAKSAVETDPAFTANFTLSGAANGDLLQFNGTKWVKFTPNYVTAEVDPTFTNNFTLSGAANGDLLQFNGTKWVKFTPNYITAEVDPTFTNNFTLSGAANGDILKYNGTKWVKFTPNYLTTETDPTVAANFTLTGAANGDLLQFNGTKWVKFTPSYLTAEADPTVAANFTLTGAVNGDILQFNGTKWVKKTPTYVSNSSVTESGDLMYYDGTNWVSKKLTLSATGNGAAVSIMQPYLTLNYCIATVGIFPSRNGVDPFLAEIMLFGGNFVPQGYAFCSGQILAISQNQALFALLGTIYGGNGTTTFALPDLRGRVAIGSGQGTGLSDRVLGEFSGSETITLTPSNLPSHTHTIVYE